jgi:hypothetical protein
MSLPQSHSQVTVVVERFKFRVLLNMWEQIGTAFALVLVIEGIMPFINPGGFRETTRVISELEDNTLRIIGFSSMMGGVILLYLV